MRPSTKNATSSSNRAPPATIRISSRLSVRGGAGDREVDGAGAGAAADSAMCDYVSANPGPAAGYSGDFLPRRNNEPQNPRGGSWACGTTGRGPSGAGGALPGPLPAGA